MDNMISFPFPLSTGEIVRLHAPLKIPIKDAKRLKRMINAMYINQQSVTPEPRHLNKT